MLIIHAVQKLLNTSRIKAGLYITEPTAGQEMHSWYGRLVATSFRGKILVMYVHEPSLIVVLARGKTISGTINQFYERLPLLMKRNDFKEDFMEKELTLLKEGFVVSKTNSRSMLGNMNAIAENIELNCTRFASYEAIDLDHIENIHMRWLSSDPARPGRFKSSGDYWKEKGVKD